MACSKLPKGTEKQATIIMQTGHATFLQNECFHSHGQHLCKFIGTKESVCIRKEVNSHRIGLGHQHCHRFIFWDTNMAVVTSRENTL